MDAGFKMLANIWRRSRSGVMAVKSCPFGKYEPCGLTIGDFPENLDPFGTVRGTGRFRFSFPHSRSHDPEREGDEGFPGTSAVKPRQTTLSGLSL
jgi:hypothetical protein